MKKYIIKNINKIISDCFKITKIDKYLFELLTKKLIN